MSDTPKFDAVYLEWSHDISNSGYYEDLEVLCQKLERECNSWKAAHDNQVKLKQIISDRPNLKERAKLVAELIEERDGWREAAYSLGEAIPASWEELQPPAAQLAKFKEMVKLQHEKYDL
jgi:hypothetical protein